MDRMHQFHKAFRDFNEGPGTPTAHALVNATSQAYLYDVVTLNAYIKILEATRAYYPQAAVLLKSIKSSARPGRAS